jgi:hypothetical protein
MHILRGLVLVLFALAGGCSYQPPKLQVVDAAVTSRTSEGFVVSFTLDASNANEEALPLREVRYTLELDGKQVFSGNRSAEATLRRLGTQRLSLPAAVPIQPDQPAPTGVVPYTLRGSLTYVTPGALAEVLFDTGVRQPKVTFRQQGTVDLGQ